MRSKTRKRSLTLCEKRTPLVCVDVAYALNVRRSLIESDVFPFGRLAPLL